MLYTEYLKVTKDDPCPFCEHRQRYLSENALAYLTYSLAPYHPHHLLVLPKRHVESHPELTDLESQDIEKLLHKGANLLQAFGHEGYTILMRNGNVSGKSMRHLHYHIVPDIHIGNVEHPTDTREIMTDEEIASFVQESLSLFAK